MDNLEVLRTKIDKIDSEILVLLQQRFKLVKKIGIHKKEHHIQPLQQNRWSEVLQNRKEIAIELGIEEAFVEKIWNEIHEYALNLEGKEL